METAKVLVTPRSFGKMDPSLFTTMEKAGIQVLRNDTDGILSKAQMMEKLAGCSGIILGVDPMDEEVMAAAPSLITIAKYGVGVDNIDLDAAKKRGIKVSRTVGANSEAVADYAMALMLALCRRVLPIDANCRKGNWQKITTRDITGARLGILGLGAIGQNVAKRAAGFSMQVLAYDVAWDEDFVQQNNIQKASVDEICQSCDFISLHLPLIAETKNIISARRIASMKPSAVLVNTARGGIVDEDALLLALQQGKIYGAGLDAFEEEPPQNPAWYTLPNVVLGSHCAASTEGAVTNMGRMAVQNLLRDLALAP